MCLCLTICCVFTVVRMDIWRMSVLVGETPVKGSLIILKGKMYQKRDLVLRSLSQLTDFQRKKSVPAPMSFVRKLQNLPYWTKYNLISPFSAYWELKLKWVPKLNKWFLVQVSEMSSGQCWYMDSGCSKHMTGDVKNFLSLKTLQGGGVSFGDGKKGYFWELAK